MLPNLVLLSVLTCVGILVHRVYKYMSRSLKLGRLYIKGVHMTLGFTTKYQKVTDIDGKLLVHGKNEFFIAINNFGDVSYIDSYKELPSEPYQLVFKCFIIADAIDKKIQIINFLFRRDDELRLVDYHIEKEL